MEDNLPTGFALDQPTQSPNVPSGFQLDAEDENEAILQRYQQTQEKYGGLGQQVKTGLEGAASAATFGLSTGLERAMGVDPEDIRGRREANPGSHMLGQGAGLIGTALIPGLGEANAAKVLTGAGKLATGAVGLGAAESLGAKIAAGAITAGAENALFQTGDEISKMLSSDPYQSVETAVTNVGLSGLFGAGVGGSIGAVSPLWKISGADKLGKAIDDFKLGTVDSSLESAAGVPAGDAGIVAGLKKLKPNAKEITEAAQEIGAPLLESQISASKRIQDIDSMLSQSPTPTGVARQQLIQSGFNAAENAVKNTLESGTTMSQVEVGNALKKGLTTKLEAEYRPIADLYDLVKQSTEHIPVSEKAKQVIAGNIRRLEGYKFKGGNMRQVADSLLENLEHITSVDDIKRFSTDLNNRFRMNASYEVGEVVEKLKNLEEASIVRAAESMAREAKNPALKDQIASLISERKTANASYKILKEKMADLGSVLGKKRPKGTADFLNFIDELTPENAAKKLFAKSNSEFLSGFAKNFPEEMSLLMQHQKGAIRDAAMKDGVLNSGTVLREVGKLSPEVKALLFSPEELKKLGAAKMYLEAMPKNVNPSGTSITEEAFRFYSSPYGAAKATVRDYGLGKLMTHLVNKGDEAALYNSVFPAIAEQIAKQETSPSALKSAVNYGLSVVKGERQIYNGTRALFKSSREVLPANVVETTEKSREKIDEKVAEYQDNPEKLLSMGGETGHYFPEHSAAMAETAGRIIKFLSDAKPRPIRPAPLDEEIEPTKSQMEEYHQVLAIADKPLTVLQKIRDNTLVPKDVLALHAMYPGLYMKLSQSITNEMIDHTSKGENVPYNLRQGLSLFLGQPLDSTLTPIGIQTAQASFMMQKQNQQAQNQAKGNTSKLNKSTEQHRTSEQALQDRKNDA